MVRLKRSALAIGLGPVPAGETGLGAEVGEGLVPCPATAVGQGVVGHHAFDLGYPELGEVLRGASQEASARVGLLVGVDFGVGQAGVVVDRGVHVFVADAGAAAGAAAFEAVAAVNPPAAAVA
jgi:hypothetical protein